MNNFSFEQEEEEEVIYDYYEKKKKNSKSLPILLILFAIIIINLAQYMINVGDILTLENANVEYENDSEEIYFLEEAYEDNYFSDDTEESEKGNSEILEFNNKFEVYFGERVLGSEVKKLLSVIDINNRVETDYKVRILFHVSGSSTTSGTLYYELSGTNSSMETYIKEIKKEHYYYIDVHETNPDGTIYSIVISDNVYKHSYKNKNKI